MQRVVTKSLVVIVTILSLPLLFPQAGFAQAFTQLQVLLPGETADPGDPTDGKSGTPSPQTVGIPFSIAIRACDDSWNTVTSVTDVVGITSTDASATLPAATALSSGVAIVNVTFNATGSFTISADDQTDVTIPSATSASVQAMLVHGFVFDRINQKNQYAGVPMATGFSAVDPNGDVVTGFSGQVNLQQITSFGVGRIEPSVVTLSNGRWAGNVTLYRADETAINRGNVNIYGFLAANTTVNGTSDPFTVHPGTFSQVQIIVPGQDPAPGSVSGVSGDPATQGAGEFFTVDVYATDEYWNPLPSSDTVRITSNDAAATTPITGALSNGFRQFTVALGTVGAQTLTVTDQTNSSITGMTTAPIMVIPNAVHHFEFDTVASPQTAGVPVTVTIRAADQGGNTIPTYNGDAFLTANTGPGSISPRDIMFANGMWTGELTFFGAGGAVSVTCADFGAPPHTGSSNSIQVQPGPFDKLQVVPAGQVAQGGTPTGVSGVPSTQQAGTSFQVQFRAVDEYWNRVPGTDVNLALSSSDGFADVPAETTLTNGELLMPVTLFAVGLQTITASAVGQSGIESHTSSPIEVIGGPYARIVILTSGQQLAPGTETGQDPEIGPGQDINLPFTVRVQATDSWFNAVGGTADVIRITSTDPLAVAVPTPETSVPLPYDIQLLDGYAELKVQVKSGGFQQLIATNVTLPSMPSSFTQFEVDEYGFHLEAVVGADSRADTYQAGQEFNLTVTARNDQGAVREDYSGKTVTVRVVNATTDEPGRGVLATTTFQVTGGQSSVSEDYSFAEPILLVVEDQEGHTTVSERVDIVPGAPDALTFSGDPSRRIAGCEDCTWVGGNQHATLSASLVDSLGNGIPDHPVRFVIPDTLDAFGDIAPIGDLAARGYVVDATTGADGVAHVDFLSGRQPGWTVVRAESDTFSTDLRVQTAFVNPSAASGYVSNYPNPFHPSESPTTIAYKLSDNADVKLEIYTLSGGLVLREQFSTGRSGGTAGLNEFVWDGRNGKGDFVSSGGYLVVVTAEGAGETLHVMRRKVAVVR